MEVQEDDMEVQEEAVLTSVPELLSSWARP